MLRRVRNLTKALIIYQGKLCQVYSGNKKVGDFTCFV